MMYGSNGYLKIMILTLLLDRYIGMKKKRKNKPSMGKYLRRKRAIDLPAIIIGWWIVFQGGGEGGESKILSFYPTEI